MALWKRPSRGLYDSEKLLFLSPDSILPNPNQPRRTFDQQELEELAASIRELGLLQPLTVRRTDESWELVAGERRLRASRLAGLTEVPCLCVRADERASSLLALVENLQRRDLDFWEEALALRGLIDTYGLSQEEAARQLGRSQSAVANKLRLLKLTPEALRILRDGGCSERHARALLRLPSSGEQLAIARRVAEEHLTVARTEALVESALAQPPAPSPKPAPAPKPRNKPTFVVKDVRLFLNTITHALDVMRSAGVNAQCRREDSEQDILLTIRIPRKPAAAAPVGACAATS